MAQILVRGLDSKTVERLKKRAKRNQRSLEAEVRLILVEAEPDDERRRVAFEFADDMRRRYAGKFVGDSTDMIRQDRDR